MGELRQTIGLRKSVYGIYIGFCVVLLVLFALCQFIKDFLNMYAPVGMITTVIQLVCVLFIVTLAVMLYSQYKKVGKITFYDQGFVYEKTNETFYYHDIMSYQFVAETNRQAKAIIFETDDNRQGELPSALDARAFHYFQGDHAQIWKAFIIDQIENHRFFSVDVLEDMTSFKLSLTPEDEGDVVLSREGIVLYNTFYEWQKVKGYQISLTGMFSLLDEQQHKIFNEPMTSLTRYGLFVEVLNHYVGPVVKKGEIHETV